jgi:hypothetical protein
MTYKCNICDKIFKQKSHLMTHKNKKFPCSKNEKPIAHINNETFLGNNNCVIDLNLLHNNKNHYKNIDTFNSINNKGKLAENHNKNDGYSSSLNEIINRLNSSNNYDNTSKNHYKNDDYSNSLNNKNNLIENYPIELLNFIKNTIINIDNNEQNDIINNSKYQCEKCGKKFTNNNNCKRHTKIYCPLNDKNIEIKKESIQCKKCFKIIKRADLLEKHELKCDQKSELETQIKLKKIRKGK